MDKTESIRRDLTGRINGQVVSNDEMAERNRLSAEYGQVWDTKELSRDFTPLGFMAPFIVVERKTDKAKGSLRFQHSPRFYFNFVKD